MKIAVTSKGKTLESQIDPRFGRAAYILIVDSATMAYEALDNSRNVAAFKGAGIKAATMVSDQGAEILLTGYCGPKAFQTLNVAGVKVVNDVQGTVLQAIEQLKEGSVVFAEDANADAHW